jgi:hypothetical protein
VRARSIPVKPSQKEVDEHEIDHAVFKDWCTHCVRGKATSFPYKVNKNEDRAFPVISVDYMFMNDNGKKDEDNEQEKGMPLAVVKDSCSKTLFAGVVHKGHGSICK